MAVADLAKWLGVFHGSEDVEAAYLLDLLKTGDNYTREKVEKAVAELGAEGANRLYQSAATLTNILEDAALRSTIETVYGAVTEYTGGDTMAKNMDYAELSDEELDALMYSDEFMASLKALYEEIEVAYTQQPDSPETEEDFQTKGYWNGAAFAAEKLTVSMEEDKTIHLLDAVETLLQTPFNERPEADELETLYYDSFEEGFYGVLEEVKTLYEENPFQ